MKAYKKSKKRGQHRERRDPECKEEEEKDKGIYIWIRDVDGFKLLYGLSP